MNGGGDGLNKEGERSSNSGPHKKNGPSEGFVAKNGKNKTGGLEKVGLTIEPKIVATTRVKNGGLGKQVTVELG